VPGGHATAVAFVEPAGHQKPGAHAPEQAAVARPGDEPNLPGGHARADEFVEPAGQKCPVLQGPEQAGVASPRTDPNVPAGHGVGTMLPEGQKAPTVQGVITVVALSLPSGHVKPGTQRPTHEGSIWPGARSAPTAGHGPEQAGVVKPVVLPKVMLGQTAGVLVPTTQ
jgi:hypothetical protein